MASRDPLVRVRRYLEGNGVWDADKETEAQEAASQRMDQAIAAAEATPDTTSAHVFDGMFAELPSHLRTQLGEVDS